jgi:hypothetical protein
MKGGPSPSSLGLLSSSTHLISSLSHQYTLTAEECGGRTYGYGQGQSAGVGTQARDPGQT